MCIPVDRGRRYRDRAAGRDIDTAALQTIEQDVSLPWGRWELSRSLRHVPPGVDRCASESRAKYVGKFPIAAMVSAARTVCSCPERGPQLYKRESRQARQQSSHWGDGIVAGLCGTYILKLTEAFAVVQARVKASTSAIFTVGRWELMRFHAQMARTPPW
jgi:hypothetical protein